MRGWLAAECVAWDQVVAEELLVHVLALFFLDVDAQHLGELASRSRRGRRPSWLPNRVHQPVQLLALLGVLGV